MIRVFIVAASPLARAGLESILTARGVEVAGSAAALESVPEEMDQSQAGAAPIFVIVLTEGLTDGLADGRGPREGAEAAFRSVLDFAAWDEFSPEASIVILADPILPGWPADALRAGIRAILPGDIAPDQLVAALGAVANGLLVVHPDEVDSVLAPVSTASASVPGSAPLAELAEALTRREREVLQMLASGRGNKEIAERLNISEHTVKFHVTSILGKLGAESRTEAVAIGIRRGLVLL